MRNLLNNPIWKRSELGLPIPDSLHAVSVALPTWSDVIDYEEKEASCINSLQSIYPRFGLNPLLEKLANEIITEECLENYNAWPYSNFYLANKAKIYCDQNTIRGNSFIKKRQNLFFLITKGDACNHARTFWQHTGLGASSRDASISLGIDSAPNESQVEASYFKIINRISKFAGVESDMVYITSSGMSALHTALEIIYKLFPKRPTLQIGFPYVDLIKLPSNIFHGANLLIEENAADLEIEIKKNNPAALIMELPSNPLLKCPNINKISTLAKKFNIPIIIDDTIGSNLNINSLEYADISFTSLTKIFAGSGDILAGSLILNPKSKWIKEFKNAINEIHIPKLSNGDLITLEVNSRNVEERVMKQNINCLKLKNRLEKHNAIKKIYHPENCPNFNSILKRKNGYGCLLSFELKGGLEKTKVFYNSLEISKGPSLGTEFTLVSPYVLLAHYNELNWAQNLGVPANLIRVSVGLEDDKLLWQIFSKALDA